MGSAMTLGKILTDRQDELLREEREVLGRLRAAMTRFEAAPEHQNALERSIEQLDELFLLVIVGEFNAGKSAFINALLGSRIVEEGVTPTTAQINILQYAEQIDRRDSASAIRTITAPVPLLREIRIVDTPGTNAIMREHEAITREFVPRSDLVLFVTSADRPFTETERAFMEQVRGWGKKILIVINKVDILETAKDVEDVRRFVAEAARTLLGFSPEIFPVSARHALRAKQGEPALWESSGFEALENHIRTTLDAPGRVQLKLMNPIGVATAVADRHATIVKDRLGLLKEDFSSLDDIERQLAVYQQDLARDFEFRMSDVDAIFLAMEKRGHEYFDDVMRIGRVMDLLNRSRMQQGFEHDVVADAPQEIERKVGELVDWMVESDIRQWQAVTKHLAERRQQHKGRIVGDDDPGRFHYDRNRLLESVRRESQRVVDTYDRRKEARELADGARNAVAAAAAVGAGALGLGTIVTVAATTAAADFTGILMASVIAAVGFFIIPAKRQQAKDQMRRKVSDVRARLAGALRDQFTKEIERSINRIRESIAPYSRFVRAEGDNLKEMDTELREILEALGSLRNRLERPAA
jgi:small GTP-binding protein